MLISHVYNVHLTWEKIAPKKVLPKNGISWDLAKKFFGENFFWVHFVLKSNMHFWNQNAKKDALTPHSPYLKNVFIS
jgi:hypothetical protein